MGVNFGTTSNKSKMDDESRTSKSQIPVDCLGAATLARNLWGLQIDQGSVKEFVGYDDKNFFLKAEPPSEEDPSKNYHPDGYVLKVTNPVDSREPELLGAQNAAMSHLAAKGFSCPRPLANLEGRLMSVVKVSTVLDLALNCDNREEE